MTLRSCCTNREICPNISPTFNVLDSAQIIIHFVLVCNAWCTIVGCGRNEIYKWRSEVPINITTALTSAPQTDYGLQETIIHFPSALIHATLFHRSLSIRSRFCEECYLSSPSEEIKSNNLLLFFFLCPLYSSSRSETRHMATWTRIPGESQFDVPSIPGFPAPSITCTHSATGKLKHSLWTDSSHNNFYCYVYWIRTLVPTSLAVSMRTTFMIITIIVFSSICDAKRKKSGEEKKTTLVLLTRFKLQHFHFTFDA